MLKDDYTIIIMSCDSYSDIWNPLVKTFEKHWNDCPFEVFLCSETKEFSHNTIGNIKVGKRMGWGEMLLSVLEQIKTPYVIYMQEDYLLKSKIDNLKIMSYLQDFETHKAAYLRLFPWPNPDVLMDNRVDLGYISENADFRTSLQCAVWDKEVLKSLTFANESGWDFEGLSIERTKKIPRPFLSVNADVNYSNMNSHTHAMDYFATGVLHGKWMREAIFFFRKQGLIINPGKRGVLTRWDYWYKQKSKNNQFKNNLIASRLNKIFNSKLLIALHNSYIKLRSIV